MKNVIKNDTVIEQLEEAKAIMSTAQSVLHWNELRDSIKDQIKDPVLRYIDTSGLITDVLISNGVYPAKRLKNNDFKSSGKVVYEYDKINYPQF